MRNKNKESKWIVDKEYDYLTVGAGLYGTACSYELQKRRKKVLVIDRRSHIAGYSKLSCEIVSNKLVLEKDKRNAV